MDQLSNHHRDISYVIHLLLGLLTGALVALALSTDRWLGRLAETFASFHRMQAPFSLATWLPIGLTIASLFMLSRLIYQSSVGRYFSEHSRTALTAIAFLCGLAAVIVALTSLYALITGVFMRGAILPLLTLIGSGIFGLLTVLPALLARRHLTHELESGHWDRDGYPTHHHGGYETYHHAGYETYHHGGYPTY